MKKFVVQRSGSVIESCIKAAMTDSGYYYIDIGGGGFNRPKRVWISRKAVKDDMVLDKLDYRITEKGNIVLIPGDKELAVIFAECGFRGYSNITFDKIIVKNSYYHSQRGTLGVSDEALIEIKEGDVITIDRSGRLYGAPKSLILQYVGGRLIVRDELGDKELENYL